MVLTLWLLRRMGGRVLAGVVAMTAVLQLLDLFETSARILDRGQGLEGVASYAALRTPHLLAQAAPLGVLAGALFGFGALARENAVTTLRAAGVSIQRVVLLASPAAAAAAAGLLVLSLWAVPRSDRALGDWWRATTPAAEREGRPPRTFRLGPDVVLASPGDEAGRRLVEVAIYHRAPDGRLLSRTRAQTAALGPGGWSLRGVEVEDYGPVASAPRRSAEAPWPVRLTASDVRALFAREPVTTRAGARRALAGGAAPRPRAFYRTQLDQMWAGPAAALVLLLAASPVALGSVRAGAWRLTVGCLAAGLLFLVADGVLVSMGAEGVLPPLLAVWTAPALFAAGSLAALFQLEGEGMARTTTPGLDVLAVEDGASMKRFIRLPLRLNAGDPNYVPPLLMERSESLSPKHNPFFEHAQVRFWLARRNGRDVGRISAQIDHNAPDAPGPRVGHFGLIAAEDDPEVFALLLRTAEDWLRERGCGGIMGPFNLSSNEEVGLLVDGFDTPPMVLMGHDPPYAGPRIEQAGYAKAKDVLAYVSTREDGLPERTARRVARGAPAGVSLRPLDMSRFDAEVAVLTDILNDAWADNWGFVPTTQAETRALAKALRLLVDPTLVRFAEIDGEAAGVIVFLPNLNEAIRDLKGRLLPFGWAKLLWRLKVRRVKSARVPLMGVKRRFHGERRGQVLPFLMIDAVRRRAYELGYETIEMSWVLEDNGPMTRIAEAVGGRAYKTYRIYEKSLA